MAASVRSQKAYIYSSRKKVFVKDSMSRRKNLCHFYIFRFLVYQMNYEDVYIYAHIHICVCLCGYLRSIVALGVGY